MSEKRALIILVAVAILSLATPLSVGKDANGPENFGAFVFLVGVFPLSVILIIGLLLANGWVRDVTVGLSYMLGMLIAGVFLVAAVATVLHAADS
jgi:hypothetical protein